MANDFQIWLKAQGYYRDKNSLVWMKDNEILSGKELNAKLNEWKNNCS